MENLHWLFLVVVIEKRGGGGVVEEGCKKVKKTRFYVYRSLLEDFCTENIITSAKVNKPKMRMLGKNPGGTFLQIHTILRALSVKSPHGMEGTYALWVLRLHCPTSNHGNSQRTVEKVWDSVSDSMVSVYNIQQNNLLASEWELLDERSSNIQPREQV